MIPEVTAEQLACWSGLMTPIYIYGPDAHAHLWANDAALEFFLSTSLDELTSRVMEPLSDERRSEMAKLRETMRQEGRASWLRVFYPRGIPCASDVKGRLVRFRGQEAIMAEIWPHRPTSSASNREFSGWAHSPRPQWLVTRSGDIVLQNPAADALGPNRMPEPGRLDELLESAPRARQSMLGLERGVSMQYRLPLAGREGDVWHELTAVAVPDAEVDEGLVLINGSDISDRRARENLLRDEWGLVRQVLDSCPLGIVVFDDQLGVVLANSAFARLHGHGAGPDLVGRPLDSLFESPARYQKTRRELISLLETGQERIEEFVLTRSTGMVKRRVQRRRIQVHGASYALVVLTDLTSEEEARLVTEAARRAAEDNARAMSEFVATASHELRTPMTGIVGMLEPLSESSLTADQAQMVSVAQECARGMLRLVDDLLEVSRFEAGGLELEPRDHDPVQLAADVIAILQQARQPGVELFLEPDPEVPRLVSGDANRVRQIVSNLVENAVKFTSEGTVTVRCHAEDGWLRYAIEDTGIGISAADQRGIFAAFSQVKRVNRRFGGTGLGLAICSRLAGAMGGHVDVESSLGVGSRFTLSVPLVAAQHPPDASPTTPLPSLRVLVVDDNPVNQMVARRMLTTLDQDVAVADSGLKAIQLFKTNPFDLILMDLQMPGMNGFECTREIKRLQSMRRRHGERAAPIVAVTAGIGPQTESACLSAGISVVLRKPFRRGDLANVIRTAGASLTRRHERRPTQRPRLSAESA